MTAGRSVSRQGQSKSSASLHSGGNENANRMEITIMSFGYKEGSAPLANMVSDVRFLKTPTG